MVTTVTIPPEKAKPQDYLVASVSRSSSATADGLWKAPRRSSATLPRTSSSTCLPALED